MSSLSGRERTPAHSHGASKPYQRGSGVYVKLGWSPLPGEGKRPKVDGHHGRHGSYPDGAEVAAWGGTGGFPEANVVLRLPKNVIGIDVDAYDGKHGAETMANLTARLGPLPPTYVSTARGKDSGSGIRYYRVPEGKAWRSNLGKESGVELIAWYLRVAAVAPSIHAKLGTMYQWFGPTGEEGDTPRPGDLPELPAPWVEELSEGAYVHRPKGSATDEEALAWLGEDVEPCATTAHWLKYWAKQLKAEASLHDTARDGIRALVGERAKGHVGAREALRELHAVFVGAIEEHRGVAGVPEARDYFMRAMYGGIRLHADDEVLDEDPCDEDDALFADGFAPSTQDGGTYIPKTHYTLDDFGNGARLADSVRSTAVWVGGDRGHWMSLHPKTLLWENLGTKPIRDAWAKVTDQMNREADDSADPKSALSWARSSRTENRIVAAIRNAQRHLTVKPDRFDANRNVLHVANGVVELRHDPAEPYRFRERRREDYATMCAPVTYDAGAGSQEWSKFLASSLPDVDDRRWAQVCAGYSLMDGNPERAWFLAIGETSSGKTTFTKTIGATLGPYAGHYNLSLFRDKREDAPRPDLLRALGRRMLYRSEADRRWSLSAEIIKEFTGNEPLSGRGMNSDLIIEAVPSFTPWLAANSVPDVGGADQALWRRLRCVPFLFGRTEEDEDAGLGARLAASEAQSAILLWLLKGWGRYLRDRLANPSPNAELLLAGARSEMTVVGRFVDDACEVGEEQWVSTEELWFAFKVWIEDNGTRFERDQANKISFGRGLADLGYVSKQRRVGDRLADRKIKGWSGLRLRELKVSA